MIEKDGIPAVLAFTILASTVQGATITLTPQNASLMLTRYTEVISTAGLLDTTFAVLGVATEVGGGSGNGGTNAGLLQPDGKIVAIGTDDDDVNGNFQLSRYNSDGSIDTSFNGGNTVNVPVGVAFSGALQTDGKIIAAGEDINSFFSLIRYNSDGSIDPTFNGGNQTSTPGTGTIHSVLLQPDGKIVGVGTNGGTFCVLRYNSDGSIDETFNGGNPVLTPGTFIAYAGLLQPDGKIVAVGTDYTQFSLVRYNSDGSIDETFNGGNPVFTPGTNTAYGAALQSDGRILAVGTDDSFVTFTVVRYTPDGSVDPTFNGGNPVFTETGDTAKAVLLQPNGQIVVVGAQFYVVRYNSDGSMDNTFVCDAPGLPGIANAGLLQSDNKIIALGTTAVDVDFCLVRYMNPFTLSSFNASYGAVGMI